MADPYNPYTQYSTPTPGGVSYYPPEDQGYQQHQPYQSQQQPAYGYGTAETPPEQNYTYAPQPSPYHLAPDSYQGYAPDRSYTPVGQPDYLGPVVPAGISTGQDQKVPENLGYYGHPSEQPRYTPSHTPRPPSVHVTEAPSPQPHGGGEHPEKHDADADPESERGVGSSLAGGAAGYYFGHKKNHGLLGAIGGAIIGNLLEHKLDEREKHSHGHRHSYGHGHHHHHRHHRHSRSRSHSRNRDEGSSWF